MAAIPREIFKEFVAMCYHLHGKLTTSVKGFANFLVTRSDRFQRRV
jgi:hypothetical protein